MVLAEVDTALIVGGLLLATGWIHPAILGYHASCFMMIYRNRQRVRSLLRWDRAIGRWTLGTTLLIAAFLALGPLVVDPTPYRDLFLRSLFPGGRSPLLFTGFAVYTVLVHAPLEEIFWRGAVTDPGAAQASVLAGNALFFGLLHAVPLGLLLGPKGLLFALPTAAAGAAWAFVTIRTRSLWPALVSHWAADALILAGMWFFFVR